MLWVHNQFGLVPDLVKAAKKGPGSRGGKIIGYTRSHKPVYSTKHSAYSVAGESNKATKHMHSHYADFTDDDHMDAFHLHENNLDDDDSNPGNAAHTHAANLHDLVGSKMFNNTKSTAIGRTRSGKVIHANGKHSESYNSQDHYDAAQAHHKEMLKFIYGDSSGEKAKTTRHNNLANKHIKAVKTAPKPPKKDPAIGSLGKTQSGKHVYKLSRADSRRYKDFTSQDHRDAAKMHEENHRGYSSYLSRESHKDAANKLRRKEKKNSTKKSWVHTPFGLEEV